MLHLPAAGSPSRQTYTDLFECAGRIAAGLADRGLRAGDVLILCLPSSAQFVAAFWGCVFAGIVPAPVAPPVTGSIDAPRSVFDRQQLAWKTLGKPRCSPRRRWRFRFGRVGDWGASRYRSSAFSKRRRAGTSLTGSLDLALAAPHLGHHLAAQGRTAHAPELVGPGFAAAQRNVAHAADVTLMAASRSRRRPGQVPRARCGGGCRQLQVATESILAPRFCGSIWCTVTGERHLAPNFAYGLVVDRARELRDRAWDLSCPGSSSMAAKPSPFRRTSVSRAARTVRTPRTAMHPAWGMSETSSVLTYSHRFSRRTTADDTVHVESDRPSPVVSVAHRGCSGSRRPTRRKGGATCQGYPGDSGLSRRSGLNRASFTADGWFRTGDLGFSKRAVSRSPAAKGDRHRQRHQHSSHALESLVERVEGLEVTFPRPARCANRGANGSAGDLLPAPRFMALPPRSRAPHSRHLGAARRGQRRPSRAPAARTDSQDFDRQDPSARAPGALRRR